MKRENVKKNIGIISAFADGKTIQILNERGEWVDLTEREGLPIGILEEEPNNFRIKPEPKYRPFKDAEECWAEMLKHQPFGYTYDRFNNIRDCITKVATTGVSYDSPTVIFFEEIFDRFVFADGVPFGIKVE
jgi:hypothetical protein